MMQEYAQRKYRVLLLGLAADFRALGWKRNTRAAARAAIALTCLLLALVLIVAADNRFFLLLLTASLSPMMIVFYMPRLLVSASDRKAESQLVPALYSLAAESSFSTPEQLVDALAARGELSYFFKPAARMLAGGRSFQDALDSVPARSPPVTRLVLLLSNTYKTGADTGRLLSSLAEDARASMSAQRDRIAALAIEKYTILACAGLIVPVMLGLVASLSGTISTGSLNTLGLGASEEIKQQLASAALSGSKAYVLLFAILASVFVSFQEGRKSKALLYALLLVPLSSTLFELLAGARLI